MPTDEHRLQTEPAGTTVWVWFDYTYYDGLLTFAQGCYRGQGPVKWCGKELPRVG